MFRKTIAFSIIFFLLACSVKEYTAKIKGYRVDRGSYHSKGQNERVRFLVLHYTVADYGRSIYILTEKQVSSHYLVGDVDDKKNYQLVREDKRAWHAGVSYWQQRENLNDSSIGIEVVNRGFIVKDSIRQFFPFSEKQIKKVALLCQNIIRRYNIHPTCVVAHADISPGRKHDPGPLFPWKKLHDKYGIGAWYNWHTVQKYWDELNFT